MVTTARGRLARLGLAAKIGIATGALALSGTAAAFTGNLPDPAQDRVADAIARTGIQIPGGKSADHRADDPDGPAVAQTPADAGFGSGVADRATAGDPQAGGGQFGEDVSSDARATFQPTDQPGTAGGPGTSGSDDAPAAQPAVPPGSDDNPGARVRDEAPAGPPEETPTSDDNPGSTVRDDAPVAEPAQPSPAAGDSPRAAGP